MQNLLELLHFTSYGIGSDMLIRREHLMELSSRINSRYLPWFDIADADLTGKKLVRLSLFQISVGICFVLLNGTLNRIMVVELQHPAWIISAMLALPLLLAPLRMIIGYKSDNHRSYLGFRRLPYLWSGTMGQFGGLALMPFVLILMTSGEGNAGHLGFGLCLFALLMVGIGMHMTQTAGLSLATDLASDENRHRVVAVLYLMLLVGMLAGALLFAVLLEPFSYFRLIQVIQGSAVVVAVLNIIAMWQMEKRRPEITRFEVPRPKFRAIFSHLATTPGAMRLFCVVALGTLGFGMQEILLEPYGAEVLLMTVSQTTQLTAIFSTGMLVALALSSGFMGARGDPMKLAATGVLSGIFGFAGVVIAGPTESIIIFVIGTFFIGLGNGLFAVGTLSAVMLLTQSATAGLVIGTWGAVQTTTLGIAIFLGGALRDIVPFVLQPPFKTYSLPGHFGYSFVYHAEIALLFAALIAIGPLVHRLGRNSIDPTKVRLADFPT